MRFLALCSLLAFVEARIMMETLSKVPKDWYEAARPSSSRRLRLSIALVQPNKELFRETLANISTPGHIDYGKHLKRDELKTLLRPESDATQTVLQWLNSSGIPESDVIEDGEWIRFSTDIQRAEEMLGTYFGVYHHPSRVGGKIRTRQYSLPEEVAKHVDMIQPTTRFHGAVLPREQEPLPIELRASRKNLDVTPEARFSPNCDSSITPSCLRKLYNMPLAPENTTVAHGYIGIAGFLQAHARYDDFPLFATKYAPWLTGTNFTKETIKDEPHHQSYGSSSVEANLDVQYSLALGYPVPGKVYTTEGRGESTMKETNEDHEPYLDFLAYLLAKPDSSLPHTLSISYGEEERSVPEVYSRVVCDMFGQLGARGVTIFVSSGDDGAGEDCWTKDSMRFAPGFPASCPYITSVGGTRHIDPEKAANFSGGGFSDIFPRSTWQDKAITAYLDILGPRRAGLYNATGRGIPDLSAQSTNYEIVVSSESWIISGTSASAPVVAGIVGLINSYLIGAGKPPLGFMNPFLYLKGYEAFQDVVTGGSHGCGRKTAPDARWNATKGWDPVTGFGTPNYQRLMELAMQQQA